MLYPCLPVSGVAQWAPLRYSAAMPERIPPRIAWAFDRLAADPIEHLLEVGCGHGVLASKIAGRLTTGTLTAIDRSGTMITVAEKRNAAFVAAGRASFRAVALADADFGSRRFDRIFAVNVNLFWIDPRRELNVVRTLLAPGAKLELFYEPPSAAQAEKLLPLLDGKLEDGGFAVASRTAAPLGIHVTARPA